MQYSAIAQIAVIVTAIIYGSYWLRPAGMGGGVNSLGSNTLGLIVRPSFSRNALAPLDPALSATQALKLMTHAHPPPPSNKTQHRARCPLSWALCAPPPQGACNPPPPRDPLPRNSP